MIGLAKKRPYLKLIVVWPRCLIQLRENTVAPRFVSRENIPHISVGCSEGAKAHRRGLALANSLLDPCLAPGSSRRKKEKKHGKYVTEQG